METVLNAEYQDTLVFFAAGVVFLAAPTCDDAPGWFSALPPALHLTVGVLLVATYALFTLGFPDDNLSAWVKADEILLLLEAATAVAGSILTLVSCDNKDPLHFVPAIAGLAGALLLVVDCAALFVMWRSRFDVEEAAGRGPSAVGGVAGGMPGDRPPPRKSIFA
ncbi:Uncharacterized protein GBIM_08446 [Gryllus bimaculatus]|nr:Uncharacterized protein GBIM_08446 [Gryllus bimaculatus]